MKIVIKKYGGFIMPMSDEEYVRSLNVIFFKGLKGTHNHCRFIYGEVDAEIAEEVLRVYKKDNPNAYYEIFNRNKSDEYIQYAIFDSGWFDIGQLGPGITIKQHRLDFNI